MTNLMRIRFDVLTKKFTNYSLMTWSISVRWNVICEVVWNLTNFR